MLGLCTEVVPTNVVGAVVHDVAQQLLLVDLQRVGRFTGLSPAQNFVDLLEYPVLVYAGLEATHNGLSVGHSHSFYVADVYSSVGHFHRTFELTAGGYGFVCARLICA